MSLKSLKFNFPYAVVTVLKLCVIRPVYLNDFFKKQDIVLVGVTNNTNGCLPSVNVFN